MGSPTSTSTSNSLTVVDQRTGKKYTIPIKNNAIDASAFKQMKAQTQPGDREEDEVGLE